MVTGVRSPPAPDRCWQEALGPFYDVGAVEHTLAAGRGEPGGSDRDALVLKTGGGQRVCPAALLPGGRPLPGLDQVVNVLPESLVSRWTVASWLLSSQPELGGARPADVLSAGGVQAVVAAAEGWAGALAA